MPQSALAQQVLSLPVGEREALFAELLSSLDGEGDSVSPTEWDLAWRAEVEARLREVEAGAVQCVPADVVLDEMRRGVRDSGQ